MANFTKQAIKSSFLKLLNEKPLNRISVRDIVEDCGINRNSFYYHFQDIPALLTEIITDETDRLIADYPWRPIWTPPFPTGGCRRRTGRCLSAF